MTTTREKVGALICLLGAFLAEQLFRNADRLDRVGFRVAALSGSLADRVTGMREVEDSRHE